MRLGGRMRKGVWLRSKDRAIENTSAEGRCVVTIIRIVGIDRFEGRGDLLSGARGRSVVFIFLAIVTLAVIGIILAAHASCVRMVLWQGPGRGRHATPSPIVASDLQAGRDDFVPNAGQR
jgi:hypothetical protein